MSKYQVKMNYSDGTTEFDGEIFGSNDDAEKHCNYLRSCDQLGGKVMKHRLSEEDYDHWKYDVEFEVVEV